MGAQASRSGDLEVSKIVVEYDQESPSGGSFYKSVVSGPLDEYIDFESLTSGIVKLMKEPPLMGLLKSTKCEEKSEKEFSTRHFFDVGSLGKLLGFEDFETVEVCFVDPGKGEFKTERYGDDETLIQTTFTTIHQDPLRVEAWVEMPESRSATRLSALHVAYILTKARELLNPELKGAINVHEETESLSGSGLKAVVSDPLDDHFEDLDQLFEYYVKALKLPPPEMEEGGKKDQGILGSMTDIAPKIKISSFEVIEVSPKEFNTITVVDGESLDKGFNWVQRSFTPVDSLLALRSSGDNKSVCVFVADRDKAEITCQAFNESGALALTTYVRFYEDPLRVEMWTEQAKQRVSGRFLCVVVWTFLNAVIKDFRSTRDSVSGEVAGAL